MVYFPLFLWVKTASAMTPKRPQVCVFVRKNTLLIVYRTKLFYQRYPMHMLADFKWFK